MSFRLKTILGIAGIEALLLAILIWTSLSYLHASNEKELIKRAATTAALFATTTKDAVLATDLASLEAFVGEVLTNPGLVYARVVSNSQGVLAVSGDRAALVRPFVADDTLDGVDDGVFDAAATISAAGKVYGRVEIGLSTDYLTEVIANARDRAALIAGIEMTLVALFSFALGVYLTRQLRGLTDGARRLAGGELGYQINVGGRDELAETARAFNEMSSSLLRSQRAQQRAERDLRQLTEDLEERVRLRTKQLAELNRRLEFQSLHDALTQLPNRMLFRDRLEQALLARRRDSGRLAAIIIDLDKFKNINDDIGHHAGDLVLQQVAARMNAALPDGATVARLGGDEFVVLVPQLTPATDVDTVAHGLLEALRQPVMLAERDIPVRASVGHAVYPADASDAATLLRHADTAMYAVKRRGGGALAYTPELGAPQRDRLALLSELRAAIEARALVLHYQPKMEFRSGRIVGVDAFVRWPHPDQGMLAPDEFLPLIEEGGLGAALTECVLELGLADCAKWRSDGLELPVAIKSSTTALQDPQLPVGIEHMLRRHDLPGAFLGIYIDETAIMLDPLRAAEHLDRLRALGVRIGIDDFGVSHALSYLRNGLIDEIKIGRVFVTKVLESENDLAIVRYTIGLAHGLGLAVGADGVESEAIWDELKTLGCDTGQGYYLGAPMPADDLQHWLTHNSATGTRGK